MSTDIRFEDGKLVVTRRFDAPRDQVFDAWIATHKVEQWWGCGKTTAVVSEIEPVVDGKYCHTMTIEGAEYPMVSRITVFEPPERLAFVMDASEHAPATHVEVTFTERGEQTEVRLQQWEVGEDLAREVRKGWTAAFEKLSELLKTEAAGAP